MAKKTKFTPEEPVTDEMIEQTIGEEYEAVTGPQGLSEDVEIEAGAGDMSPEEQKVYDNKTFTVRIPFTLKIGRKLYHPGVHTVKRGIAEVMNEMSDKKRRADMSVHVGKNYLVERLLDHTLSIKEVPTLGNLGKR